MGIAALVLLLLGGLLWVAARRLHATSGLPQGRLVSADTWRWLPASKPLFSDAHQLTGRPDYLIRNRDGTIPVEVKSARIPPNGPREGHILQLAAYCLLVSETENKRPAYGLVKYADAVFRVEFTCALERSLLDTLDAMRRDLSRGYAHRSHTDAGRCRTCGYRHACNERVG